MCQPNIYQKNYNQNLCCYGDVSEGADEEDEGPVENLLKPGHLTRFLEEELTAEVEALCVGDVNAGLERLLVKLRTHTDSCQSPQLQVPTATCIYDVYKTLQLHLK